jgi:hypothetical protein
MLDPLATSSNKALGRNSGPFHGSKERVDQTE